MSLSVFPPSALEARIGRPGDGPPPLEHGSLRSWETWVSLVLVLVAFLAVTSSIEQADWVPEMPSLSTAALVGLAAGFALAHVKWPGAILLVIAAPVGMGATLLQTAYAMNLSDPSRGSGLSARWGELVLRLQDWFQALLEGDVSTDPMPFILLVVLLSWTMAFVAAWSVFRLRNGWLAVIPAGFALLTNISYLPGQPSLAFIVFLFAAILLVTRMHAVRANAAWRRERVSRPPLLTLEVLNFATWAGVVLIIAAWLVPTANHWGPVANYWQEATAPLTDRFERVGRVFFGIDSKRVDLVHKFGDVLPLQGRVRLSSEPLLSAQAPAEATYLRAAVYDEYTGRGWRLTQSSTVALPAAPIDAASFGTPLTRAQFRKPQVVDVQLKSPAANRRLLTAGEPLAASLDANLLVGRDQADVVGLAPAARLAGDASYQAVGTVSAATSATLGKAPADYPQWVLDRYLQLPAELPVEVKDLAASLTKDVSSPYLKARRIEQALRADYAFDLNVPDPSPRQDAVAQFLLQTKRGYFDQHASAMVVLLRSAGVPARLAVGFALDQRDFDQATKSFVVSDRAAWAWPEVYFAGLGWVEFNPTPTRSLVQRPLDDSEFGAQAGEVEGGEFDPAEGLLLDPFEVDPTAGGTLSRPLSLDGDGATSRLAAVLAQLATLVVFVALVVLLAAVGVRVWWVYRYRRLTPSARRWARLQDLAVLAALAPATSLTPLEAAREVGDAINLRSETEALARAYTAERYGAPRESGADSGVPDSDEDTRLDAAYAAVRTRLLRSAARRLLPRRARGTRTARASGALRA